MNLLPRYDWHALTAWAVLVAFLIAWPWAYDALAARQGWESMSRFMRWVLFAQLTGPIFWGLWVGVPTGIVIHFLLLRTR